MTKDQLRDIFIEPDRYEDGMRQLMTLLEGDPMRRQCYALMARHKQLKVDLRERTLSYDDQMRHQNQLLRDTLSLIEEIPQDRLKLPQEVRLLILADGEAQQEKFEHYYQRRFPLPQVRVEVIAPPQFEAPFMPTREPDSQAGQDIPADCLLFDGSNLPHSGSGEQLSDVQRARLDLLLAYLNAARYLEIPQPPLIFFGPNRNELFAPQYQDRYLGANSWITLYTQTKELVEFVRAGRGEG